MNTSNTPQHRHQPSNSKANGCIHIGDVSNDVKFCKESVKDENELSIKPQTSNETNEIKKEGLTKNNSVHVHSVEETITLPPKLRDPGTPIVSIQVGELKIDKAILDLGACVSILPGKLYDQHYFGPLHKVNTKVVLADLSYTCPRGMVKDVLVRIGEFYQLVDFIVLDSATTDDNTHPTVLLGRPFLATAHAIINCTDGTVSLKMGDRVMRVHIMPNATNHEGGEKCSLINRYEGSDTKESPSVKLPRTKGKRKVKKPPEVDDENKQSKPFGLVGGSQGGPVCLLKREPGDEGK